MTGKERNENAALSEQRLLLQNRSRLELSGVSDVVSFDDVGALIKTVNGMLAVDGEGLHVIALDLGGGNICFEGKINGLFFSDAVKGKGKRFR